MKNYLNLLILFVVVSLLLSACGGSPSGGQTVPTVPAQDSGQDQGNAMVTIGTLTPEYRVVAYDLHRQNNCGGNSSATYGYEQSRSVSHTMTVESGFTVSASGEVGVPGNSVELGAEVSAQFGQSYGEETSVSRSLELSAQPGSYLEHKINLVEVWQHGIAKADIGGESYEIPFAYRSDFGLELAESKQLPCPEAGFDLTVYDPFSNSCIDFDLWKMALDSLQNPIFLPDPSGDCWTFKQGFKEDTSLHLDHKTRADYQSFSLVTNPPKSVSIVELDFDVASIKGDWAGIGIFTRLNDADRTWAYYTLHFGDSVGAGYWKADFEAGNTHLVDDHLIPIHGPVTLTLVWDGAQMKFQVDGVDVLAPVPFDGLSDTFGVYWVTAPNTTISARVTEIRTGLIK